MAEFLGIPGSSGVLVLEVQPGTPAERAALKAGDVIVSVDGKEVSNSQELSRALSGDEIRLEVLRQGQPLSLTVQLDAKEPSSQDSIRL
jgi:S1-C subfamily serine protease